MVVKYLQYFEIFLRKRRILQIFQRFRYFIIFLQTGESLIRKDLNFPRNNFLIFENLLNIFLIVCVSDKIVMYEQLKWGERERLLRGVPQAEATKRSEPNHFFQKGAPFCLEIFFEYKLNCKFRLKLSSCETIQPLCMFINKNQILPYILGKCVYSLQSFVICIIILNEKLGKYLRFPNNFSIFRAKTYKYMIKIRNIVKNQIQKKLSEC